MAQRIGIRQTTEQRIISGCRVAFDPRKTEEVNPTRDPENYKAREKFYRTQQWEERMKEKRAQRAL